MSTHDPLSRDFATSGVYYVEFLAKCFYDTRKSDSLSRWWVEWHGFTTLSNGDIDLEPRCTKFCPNRSGHLAKFTPFGDTVNLLDPSLYMLGLFKYLQPDHVVRTTGAVRYRRLPSPSHMATSVQLVSLLWCRCPQYVPTITLFSRIFLLHHHPPHHPSIITPTL